jgi:hypothetical protein
MAIPHHFGCSHGNLILWFLYREIRVVIDMMGQIMMNWIFFRFLKHLIRAIKCVGKPIYLYMLHLLAKWNRLVLNLLYFGKLGKVNSNRINYKNQKLIIVKWFGFNFIDFSPNNKAIEIEKIRKFKAYY